MPDDKQLSQTATVEIHSGEDAARASRRVSARGTFAALQYPNYRLWFIGQMVSLIGTWMQSTAQGYLVYELTGSPAYLGYVGFAAGVPSWLFMLYGGVIADRMPRRTLLVLTQTSMMVLAFLLAGLTFTGRVQAWQIIVLAFFLGTANAFDAPARQAFVLEMVDREHLTNAIALNSTMFNLATAVGPAVAGLTYSVLGPAWCFFINAISFLAVIIALLLMKLRPTVGTARHASALAEIRLGFGYVRSNRLVRAIILNLGVLSLFGLGFIVLMPAWAVDVLGGDATTLGLLQSARGVGAVVGALMIAAVAGFIAREKLLAIGSFVFPILLLVYAGVRWLPLSLAILVGVGWAFMVVVNSSNSLVQTQVPDALRGRVMGIFTFTFFGLMPIGSLLAGAAAARIGEPLTVVIGGAILLGLAVWIRLRIPELRAS